MKESHARPQSAKEKLGRIAYPKIKLKLKGEPTPCQATVIRCLRELQVK